MQILFVLMITILSFADGNSPPGTVASEAASKPENKMAQPKNVRKKSSKRKDPSKSEIVDYSRCNNLSGHAGVSLRGEGKPIYRIGDSLEFDGKNPRALLISQRRDELEYYEYIGKKEARFRVGNGFGAEGVLHTRVKVSRDAHRPWKVEARKTWFPLDGKGKSESWEKVKRDLRSKKFRLKKTERTHFTESWIQLGYSGNRCYVSQEGEMIRGQAFITFDQALCNQVLRITEAHPEYVLEDYRSRNEKARSNANRELRLIRDAQINRDESLKGKGFRLLSVMDKPPEHLLPGTIAPEDSAALLELRSCIAAQVRNGLRRPEALSRENTDFMGAEPAGPEEEMEPSATGIR